MWLVPVAILYCAIIFAGIAHANPSLFTSKTTATATTTVAFLQAGTGTTTLTYDASLQSGDSFASNGAVLLIQFAGSSTLSTLNADIQYSQDGADWYSIAQGSDISSGIGSSSPSLSNPSVITLSFASTTVDKSAGNTATTTRMANFTMPTRFIRAIFTIPVGALNGALWAQFVAQKQNR